VPRHQRGDRFGVPGSGVDAAGASCQLGLDELLTESTVGARDECSQVWDVSHPTRVVDAEGRSFEFDHAWAQNFTRLTCNGQQGLAHFECVVITEAQEWTAHPGRTDVGGSGE